MIEYLRLFLRLIALRIEGAILQMENRWLRRELERTGAPKWD